MSGIVVLLLGIFLGVFLLFEHTTVFANRERIVQDNSFGAVRGAQDTKDSSSWQTSVVFPVPPTGIFQPVRRDDASDIALTDAHVSLILDVDSGTILHYDKGREKRPIASLTKLVMAMTVIDHVKSLEEEVVIDKDVISTDGTIVGCPRAGFCISNRLFVDERVFVKDLLTAALVSSANDAAVALAIHTAGSEPAFVTRMNRAMQELGLTDSNFCTASGLEPDGAEGECYSTAYDIARVGAHILTHEKYSALLDILRVKEKTITNVEGTITHELLSTNRLLNIMPGLLGTKTGFTPQAGQSLFLAAEDPASKHRIIAVVLDDPYRWQDVQRMIAWAFETYQWQ